MMKVNKILLSIVIILSLLPLISCNKSSDVDALSHRIDEFVTLVEERKEQELTNYLADDFLVVKRFNKTQFILFSRYQIKKNKNISISVIDKEITLNENYADVTANVLLLGSNDWIPERGQMYNIASRWKKESDEWVMSRLRWSVK